MNIIFLGSRATGKSLLAELLAEEYKRRGDKVEILNDETCTTSMQEGFELAKRGEKLLQKTHRKEHKHLIVTTQAAPTSVYRLYEKDDLKSLYDFIYYCYKG